MKDADEQQEKQVLDVENIAKQLFIAYPNANYIAMNPAITEANQEVWKDHWYLVGFIDQPVYKLLEGVPAWVANKSISKVQDEWGLFFLHISSKDHVFKGVPFQKDPYDFASPRFFCWRRNPDGTLTQIVADEIKVVDRSTEVTDNINELTQETLVKPVIDMLEGKK